MFGKRPNWQEHKEWQVVSALDTQYLSVSSDAGVLAVLLDFTQAIPDGAEPRRHETLPQPGGVQFDPRGAPYKSGMSDTMHFLLLISLPKTRLTWQ